MTGAYAPCAGTARGGVPALSSGAADRARTPTTSSRSRRRQDARAALARAGGRCRDRRGNGQPRARVTFASRSSWSTPRGEVSRLPTARVWVARDARGEAVPRVDRQARAHRRAGRRGGGRDAHLRGAAPASRARDVLASRRARGREESVQALGNVVVSDRRPRAGRRAIPRRPPRRRRSRRPAATLSKLTTRTPPDESLLQHSVAESLRAKVPFVVTFSTPKFCSSRTCGPVVDVVEEVARRVRG